MSSLEVELDLVFLPGRFDRAASLLDEQVDRWAGVPSVDAILCTEVDRPMRGDVLRGRDDWALLRDGSGATGETAIMHRRPRWERVAGDCLVLDRELVGARNAQVAPIELLEHRETGLTLLLTATHLPSSVEQAWQHGRRAAEHRASVEAWRRHTLAWRQRFRPDAVVAFADWNLDLHREFVRRWVADAWPGLHPLPPRLLPDAGTHGARFIDWPLTRGVHDRHLRVLPSSPASDHRGTRLTGTVHARKGKRS